MTSISSNYAALSPRDRLQNQLVKDISAGAVAAADKGALSAAMDSIDSSLKADRASGQSGPPAAGDIRSKIDGLIQQQVDSGALTGDQAKELKQVFSDAFSGQGARGHHRHHPVASGDQANAASSSTDPGKLLDQFLQSLKDGAQASASYSADGARSNPGALSLLVNVQA